MKVFIFLAFVVILTWSIAMGGRKKINKQKPLEPSRKPLTDAEREAIRQADEVFDKETSDAIYNGTYAGPLPEKIDDKHWSDLYPDIYRTAIAGVCFRHGIKDLVWSYFDCRLVAEPDNRRYPDAIMIVNNADDRKIGYIPVKETDAVRQFINGELPYPCRAHIEEMDDYDFEDDFDYNFEEEYDNPRARTFLVGWIIINRPKVHS